MTEVLRILLFYFLIRHLLRIIRDCNTQTIFDSITSSRLFVLSDPVNYIAFRGDLKKIDEK